jgi:hypothetical protein
VKLRLKLGTYRYAKIQIDVVIKVEKVEEENVAVVEGRKSTDR